MTPGAGTLRQPDAHQRAVIARLILQWRALHQAQPAAPHAPGPASGAESVDVVETELLVPGRPGLLDVIATVDGRTAHGVLGLLQPGDELRPVPSGRDPLLGTIDDDRGVSVVVDAVHEAQAARLLLGAVAPVLPGPVPVLPTVAPVTDGPEDTTLAFEERWALTVFPWIGPGPHPGVGLLLGLDEAGFNHLRAPVAVWRRGGRDLGLVQEILVGSAGGWALAFASLRDLFAAGGLPEEAGGDFGPEARGLGTMAARMHLALDRSFGRRPGDVAAWVEEARSLIDAVEHGTALPAVSEAVSRLGGSTLRLPELRTHGDFHLGRTARTDQGWVLDDCMPGGVPPGATGVVFRPSLCDVADMVWSFRHAAVTAASEWGRDQSDRRGFGRLAAAWEARNRRAFMSGYLSTPGIEELVPAERDVVERLVVLFEFERGAREELREG